MAAAIFEVVSSGVEGRTVVTPLPVFPPPLPPK
jgi:hypothetical protein